MSNFSSKITLAVLVVLLAFVYQTDLPRIITILVGKGRTVDPLSAFPYECRRLNHERLRACEDMWFSESTRQLFLACSEPLSRSRWFPNGGSFNISGRNLNDSITVIDVDVPAGGVFEPRALETPNFFGTNGDGHLHLNGMTGMDDEAGAIRLWVINAKPSVDPVTGEFLNPAEFGANTTVELFRTGANAKELEHVKTFAHPQIATPNRIAAIGQGDSNAFYFTNDHGLQKTGWRSHLNIFIGGCDVSFCDDETCREVVPGQKLPNGLVTGRDGLIYVPSSLLGSIDVFQPQPNGSLTKVDHIDIGYGIDNLSVDSDGDIFVAGFPDSWLFFKSSKDPYNLSHSPPSAAFRVRKTSSGYEVSKAIEDAQGEALPGSTTVVHDAKTGRFFMSGVFSPFITVCDPKIGHPSN